MYWRGSSEGGRKLSTSCYLEQGRIIRDLRQQMEKDEKGPVRTFELRVEDENLY